MRNHFKNYDYKITRSIKEFDGSKVCFGFFLSKIFQSEINKTCLKHFITSNVITPGVLRSPVMCRSLFIHFRYALNNFKKSFKQHYCNMLKGALSFSGLVTTSILHIIPCIAANRGHVTITDVCRGCYLVVLSWLIEKSNFFLNSLFSVKKLSLKIP